jgi:hypothetical protein
MINMELNILIPRLKMRTLFLQMSDYKKILTLMTRSHGNFF